jgi:hypothetical protein
MDLGCGEGLEASIGITAGNGDPSLQVYELHSDEAFVTERLLSFDSVRFNAEDPLYITFHGRSVERNFKLRSEEAMASLWIGLQSHVDLLSVPGKSRAFMIVSKKRTSGKLARPMPSFDPAMERHSSVPETAALGRESPPPAQRVLASSSSLEVIFPGGRLPRSKRLGTEIEVPDKVLFDTWCHILNVDISHQNVGFDQLQILWNDIPLCQWERNASLRKIVRTLEESMPSVNLKSPPQSRLAFDVLMHCMFLTEISHFFRI